jgi:site-specific DNA recombinase
MRYVGVVRLSNRTEETTSPERQREIITRWAESHDHEIIGWAVDLGISASVSPWERPELGEWLRRPGDYDGLVAWRVDRLARRVLHFAGLIDWCQEHGKDLASATEPFDLSTQLGRMFAQMVAMLAEGELEAIRERVSDAHAYLRKAGRWGGGVTPYGYMPVKRPDGKGWEFAEDPDVAPILREIVSRVLNKEPYLTIARDLNERGVPAPKDHARIRNGKAPKGVLWHTTTVRTMITSEALLGRVTYEGKVIRDPEGMPVQRGPALVDRATWDLLQARAKERNKPHKRRVTGASLLLHVAYCTDCGEPLYQATSVKRGQPYAYYRCPTGMRYGERQVTARADQLDEAVTQEFLAAVGSLPVMRREEDPGEDYSEELAQVDAAMRELREDRAAGLYRGERGSAEYRQMYARLESRRERLEALPSRPPTIRLVPTGETYSDKWADSDTAARRRMLLDAGVRADVSPAVGRHLRKLDPARVRVRIGFNVDVMRDEAIVEMEEAGVLSS